jgi:hypothetical protein
LEDPVSCPNEGFNAKTFEQLCEEASRETDTQKLIALTGEIDRRLEEQERRAKASAA